MSPRSGARRLRKFGIAAVSAVVAVGLGFGVPAAMADNAEPSTETKANAQLLDPQCAVPPDRDLNVTKKLWQVASSRGVTDKVMLAMFETGWVESHMNNLNCGDRDSVGVFQQRPSMGWCDPASLCRDVEHATNKFLDQAIPNDKKNPGYSAGQLAQSVQRSGYPDRYDENEGKAKQLMAEVSDAPMPDPEWPVIKDGSAGGDVSTAQYLLTKHGEKTDADGEFGPKTTSSVKAFQKAKKLEVDGVVGPKTWAKLIVNVASGDSGSAVKALQTQLKSHGASIEVDGEFGPKTESALKDFQKRAELEQTGKTNKDTWFALIGT